MPEKKKTSDKQDVPLDKVEDAVVVNDPSTKTDKALTDKAETTENAAEVEGQSEPAAQSPEEIVSADTTAVSYDAEKSADEASAEVDANTGTDTAADAQPYDSKAETSPETAGEAQTETAETAGEAPEEAAGEPPADRPLPPLASVSERVVIRKGGFVPMVLGGIVAAVIGFGLARSGVLEGMPLFDSGAESGVGALSEVVNTQAAALTELESRLTALENAPAPEVPAADAPDITPQLEDVNSQIDALAQRISALEERPAVEAPSGDGQAEAALAETRSELDEIRQLLEAQRAEVAALSDEAAREEEAAQLTARRALQRAALTRIQTALDSGTGYSDALGDLQDTDLEVPQTLAAQADSGVATLAALQTSFPDAARDALRAARQEAGGTGISGFLQTQLGVRSLEPREGDDADAILSRAEAALRDGRLADAVAEVQSLTGAPQAEMAEWQGQAETRLATVAAAQELAQTLNAN
ncbi:MAG: mitofilin family membrane protein [Rhodobacterales bacterium]